MRLVHLSKSCPTSPLPSVLKVHDLNHDHENFIRDDLSLGRILQKTTKYLYNRRGLDHFCACSLGTFGGLIPRDFARLI